MTKAAQSRRLPSRGAIATLGAITLLSGCFNRSGLDGLPCIFNEDCGPGGRCVIDEALIEDPNAEFIGYCGGNSGGGGDIGGDGDGDGDIDVLATAYCDALHDTCGDMACFTFPFLNREQCLGEVRAELAVAQSQAATRGLALDPGCVQQRVDLYTALGANSPTGACVYYGNVASWFLEDIDSCQGAFCHPFAGEASEGGSCTGTGLVSNCAPGLLCDGSVCFNPCAGLAPLAGPSETCGEFGSGAPVCGPPGYCDVFGTMTCMESPDASGIPCPAAGMVLGECGPAHYCHQANECRALKADLEPCATDTECRSFFCDMGLCLAEDPLLCQFQPSDFPLSRWPDPGPRRISGP